MTKKVEKKVIKKVAKVTLVSSKLVKCDDGEQRMKYVYSDKSVEYRVI